MSAKIPFEPDYAFPPGATLLEAMESLGLSSQELAAHMGQPLAAIDQIINGTTHLMPEMTLQLEIVTGVPASFWNRAESNYREHMARLKDAEWR